MFITIFEIIFFVFILTFAIAGYSAAPWVPARKKDITRFMEAGNIQPGDTVIDLGCGDGRLLFAAMQRGASSAIGYEISLLPFCIAQVRCMFTQKKLRPQIIYKNFWHADIRNANVIYTFLMSNSFDQLLQKLRAELPPHARLVNYVWALPNLIPEQIFEAPDALKLYRYHIHAQPTTDPNLHTS
jgi:SAM-dependent methyltransferase